MEVKKDSKYTHETELKKHSEPVKDCEVEMDYEVKGHYEGTIVREKDWYKDKIVEMVDKIEDKRFLNQIRTLLKLHIEKRGG